MTRPAQTQARRVLRMYIGHQHRVITIVLRVPLHAVNTSASIAEVQCHVPTPLPSSPATASARKRLTPLKGKRPLDIDIVVVRENTEDVYTQPGRITGVGNDEVGEAPMRFTRPGIERIVRYAFALARSRPKSHLTLVDKSNAIPIQ